LRISHCTVSSRLDRPSSQRRTAWMFAIDSESIASCTCSYRP